MPKSWNEYELRKTIQEYFLLLEKNQSGLSFNKSKVYRKLHEDIPTRSVKSIEYKFQNISAVLYEEKIPYLSGLKPRFNYQKLMRLIVLEELGSLKIRPKEPWEILTDKLKEIKVKEPLKVLIKGSGRFGLTIEKELGILQNSDKKADFMGIELKTKAGKTHQTLFARTPSEYFAVRSKSEFFDSFSYYDKKNDRKALYTSVSSLGDSLGFTLVASRNCIEVYKDNNCLMKYSLGKLEEALLSKHSQTFFITVKSLRKDDIERMEIQKVVYCKKPSIENFVELVKKGKVHLDFTLSEKNGKIKDHGFLWRIHQEAIEELYQSRDEIQLI
ncbi:MAG: MvaI/BcnI family restriction endonuclease [Bacteroidia bacterium]|nr:MvaI/BcnI family restriction endonuclease [Bacteroidia bacterium]